MVAVRPVAAWVVDQDFAPAVVGPAYDALGPAERRALADADRDSFFNVLRSPVDLDAGRAGREGRADELLDANAAALERLLGTGRYRPPPGAALYLYGLRSGDHAQTAVVGDLPVRAVRDGAIRPHERTRSAKEAELADHLRHLRMQSSPVGLTYRADPAIDALVAEARRTPSPGGPRHRRRRRAPGVGGARPTHRPARRRLRRGAHAPTSSTATTGWRPPLRTGDDAFLAGLVPDDQLRLLPYHRVVAGPLAAPAAEAARPAGRLAGGDAPARPRPPGRAGIAVVGWQGTWYEVPLDRPAGRARRGRGRPGAAGTAGRRGRRPHRPAAGLRARRRRPVPPGRARPERAGLAVALHPPTVAQLVAEADAGRTMPPKSTWFEPKLRSGCSWCGDRR